MSEHLLDPVRGERPRIISIVGPTASGKSSVALDLAESLGGEIISADSLQVYRGLDIGTAKPPAEHRARVPHHLLDLVDPDEPFNVARFKELADAAITGVQSRGKAAIVVGGTGLYIKVLLRGIFPAPPVNDELRQALHREHEVYGPAYLHDRLRLVDPGAAQRIAPNDLVRIVRALEVFEQTGIPLSEHQLAHSFHGQDYQGLELGIDWSREELYRRVEERVERMMAAGLLDEVKGLLSRGHGPELKPMQSLGYKQLCEAIDGKGTVEDAARRTKRETKRYAKRQLTWFRSDPAVKWLTAPVDVATLTERCRKFLAGEAQE